jgi:predicted deacylase
MREVHLPRRTLLLSATSLSLASVLRTARADDGSKRHEQRLLGGTRWETTCHVQTSGRPGPVVVVMGGVHGDEPAGSHAAEAMSGWSIDRGSLLVLPRVNGPALRAGSRFSPRTRHTDLARCFPRSPGEQPHGPLAGALWRLLVRLQPDWLVDLHEGWGVHRRNPETLGSTVMHAADTRGSAERMVRAVNGTIASDRDHFTPVQTFIPGSSVFAASRFLSVACVVQETTRAGRKLPRRVHQHEVMARRLLMDIGMLRVSARRW